ncbi:hypothetical protein AAG570_010821 [Ranatra chinensis]|uniref:RNA-directed DNA polymerase n=1 Tax=Ranatra chinensis TaxID=642074 RepID=A0ABD0Z123_9HEMI
MATELDVRKNKMEELNKLLDAFSGEKSQERKIDTGLTHLLNRVERSAPPDLEMGQVRSAMLSGILRCSTDLESKVKGQNGKVDTSSSEAEEQDEGAVSRCVTEIVAMPDGAGEMERRGTAPPPRALDRGRARAQWRPPPSRPRQTGGARGPAASGERGAKERLSLDWSSRGARPATERFVRVFEFFFEFLLSRASEFAGNKLFDAYSGEKSQERKIDTGLTHLLNRVERVAPPDLEMGQICSALLSGILKCWTDLESKVKGQIGEVDTSSSEAEEQDEGAVSRVREPTPEPTRIRTVMRQTQVPVRDWGVTFSGDGQGPSLVWYLCGHNEDVFFETPFPYLRSEETPYPKERGHTIFLRKNMRVDPISVDEFLERGRRVQRQKDHMSTYQPPPPVRKDTLEPGLPYRTPSGEEARPAIEGLKSQGPLLESMIRKKDGSYRFCVDYRKVNAVTRRDAYPLPYVSHILDRLRNARYLSSLDVKSAYWPLSEESKERTAFTVPGRELFQFTRMPFGLHNSPATWQRLIDQVLGPELERHVFVYLDYIIVCSAQFDEHMETLDRVFKKLKEAGLTLNLDKCQFCRPELRYLGYVADRTGLWVDAQKVEYFSTVAAPLTDLLKKGRVWLWSGECERAFAQLKEHLVTAPILTCPDFDRPFIVQTDASGKGIGTILSQELPDGERVVAYASRVLSKAERSNSTTEQECLAVTWAVEKFRPYLEGTEFTVVTDHAVLEWFNGLKDPVGRLARWALRLQQHPFKVVHRRGKLHAAPDALSRDTAEVSCSVVEVTESSRDGWYQGMIERVRKDLQQRLVVPKPLRPVVLLECRDSHPAACLGVFRARQWIQRRYYWPGMRTDVERFVARSRACLPIKPGTGRPKGPEGTRRGEDLSHREDTVA